MKKLIILFLAIPSICFASQKVFYNPQIKLTIVDVSGKKTQEDIKKEFGEGDYQELQIDEKKEAGRIIDGNLTKYDYNLENEQKKQQKEQEELIKKQQEKEVLKAEIIAEIKK